MTWGNAALTTYLLTWAAFITVVKTDNDKHPFQGKLLIGTAYTFGILTVVFMVLWIYWTPGSRVLAWLAMVFVVTGLAIFVMATIDRMNTHGPDEMDSAIGQVIGVALVGIGLFLLLIYAIVT